GIVATQTLGVEKCKELAEGRKAPRLGARRTSRCHFCNVAPHLLARGVSRRTAMPRQMRLESEKIAPIGIERVAAGTAFGRHHVEKGFDARQCECGPSRESGCPGSPARIGDAAAGCCRHRSQARQRPGST